MKSTFLHYFKTMRFSIIAFVMTLVLSLFSINVIGAGLFFIASPLLLLIFPLGLDEWSGDWLRPVMIGVPIIWSFGFLMAGRLSMHLEKLDWTKMTVQVAYMVTLMIWNMLIWIAVLLAVKPEIA